MTAENYLNEITKLEEYMASMRPRPMTAENSAATVRMFCSACRFNEAAADDRGKLPVVGPAQRRIADASMRPRPMTAENVNVASIAPSNQRCASMRPRPMTAENRS